MNEEYEAHVTRVAKELKNATTADEIRRVWKMNLILGHRLLGRLLIGREAEDLLEAKRR